MWLNAYSATSHHVYFGRNKAKVADATPESAEYQTKITDDGNGQYLKESLTSGVAYYWRTDAEMFEKINYKETSGLFERNEHSQSGLYFKMA